MIAWPRFLLLLGHTSKFFLKISITLSTDEIVFARIALTTKEEAELMQKQEKMFPKTFDFMPGPQRNTD